MTAPDPVEVAVPRCLLARLEEFTDIPKELMQLPNYGNADGSPFVPPSPAPNVKWLRARYLPNESISLGISDSSDNQHYGYLQVDVMCGAGGGEAAPGRVAAALIQHFRIGSRYLRDGFDVCIYALPYRGPLMFEDVWVKIPVNIPWRCFTSNPA